MAKNDRKIAENYVTGIPAEDSKKLFAKVYNGPGHGWSGGGPLYRPDGTKRFWYDGAGFFYSYRMPLAYRTLYDGKPFILVNGDGAPSKMTSQHQRTLRAQIQPWSQDGSAPRHAHAYIPFSVLTQAGISPEAVKVIAVTEDFEQKRIRRGKDNVTGERVDHEYTTHFLGETLFQHRDSFYVCGLDRNDDPNKRSFYMAKIPGSPIDPPKSVDEALLRLRPEGLPEGTKRQGEWFFVPTPEYAPPRKGDMVRATRVPIIADDPKAQLAEMVKTVHTKRGSTKEVQGWTVRSREKRHVASTMVINGAVYAKGVVFDEEHTALRLGKTWHKVVKNLAIEGWRYTQSGVKVD